MNLQVSSLGRSVPPYASIDKEERLLGGEDLVQLIKNNFDIDEYRAGLSGGVVSLRSIHQIPLVSVASDPMAGYDLVLHYLAEMTRSDESDEIGRLGTSEAAIESAQKVAFQMLCTGELTIPEDISTDRDGAVRILWGRDNKIIELISPFELNQRPYVYFSDDKQHRVALELSRGRLARLLSWLNGPNTDFPK